MKKVTISIEPQGAPMGSPVPSTQEAQESEESMYQVAAPKGNYTIKGLNPLVIATNKLLPLFGQEPTYPKFSGPLKELPTDFVRVLTMFKTAVDDAIAEEEVAPEMAFELDGIVDDTTLAMLAGKLSKLAIDKAFKKFLSSPPKDETKASEAGEEAGMPEEESGLPAGGKESIDNLFMSRM